MFPQLLEDYPIWVEQFFRFVGICLIIGPLAFIFGLMLPRKNFDYRFWPYKAYPFEKGGSIYLKIRIQYWKDRVPDMSKMIKTMFRKKITVYHNSEYTRQLICETCVAEFTHNLLIVLSPIFLIFMEGMAAMIGMTIYVLGNVPFILIQRYNRPRLVMIMERQVQLEESAARKKRAREAEAAELSAAKESQE